MRWPAVPALVPRIAHQRGETGAIRFRMRGQKTVERFVIAHEIVAPALEDGKPRVVLP